MGAPATATLLILAGGDSRRMGRTKALLPVAGTTLVEWVLGRLAGEFEQVLVAARTEEEVPAVLRRLVVRDLHVGAGPLAGIEAGLAAARHPVLVAVACDMPRVDRRLLHRLLAASEGVDAAVPRVGGRPEPACAAYRQSAAGPLAAALAAGRLKAADALTELRVRWLDGEDPALFANLNTPADHRDFLATLDRPR